MWAYKSYNPNAPDPEEPSDASEPQARPSVPRHFSFRSLLGRYREPQERPHLAEKFIGLVNPRPPNTHATEDEPSNTDRNRRVSFSSQASGRSNRSRKSQSSTHLSRFLDGGSSSRSEVMLAEIMELLTEMKDDINKAKREPSDGEDSDSSTESTTPGSSPGKKKKSQHNGPLGASLSAPSSQVQAPSTSVETVSAAAKKAAIAGTKEYAKHKLNYSGGTDDSGTINQASIMAAVEKLTETLGHDVKPADVIGELPSLEHLETEGLQEIVNGFHSERNKARPPEGPSAENTTTGRPAPHSKPGRPDKQLVSNRKRNDKPVDKHDWDKRRPPQAFDWPTQEEIDRDNTIGFTRDRMSPATAGPGSKSNAAARQGHETSIYRSTVRTQSQSPSPEASTTASDLGAPVVSYETNPPFNIVFPSTPLHQPGEKTPSAFATETKGTKTAKLSRENVVKSEQSDQGSQLINPAPNAIGAQSDQVANLFHQHTSALMQSCLGKYVAATIL